MSLLTQATSESIPAQLKHKHLISESEVDSNFDSDSADKDALNLPDHIVSSPYAELSHQLDLRTLAKPVGQFAEALTSMTAIRADYATAPYHSAFNWSHVVRGFIELADSTTEEISFFVIVFRSRLKTDANRELLGELDKKAHLEAIEAGGLLKYWFGTPDHNRRNLATCLWRARDDARLGGAGPGHAAAMTAARSMYDEWFVERLRLSIDVKAASWTFSIWTD